MLVRLAVTWCLVQNCRDLLAGVCTSHPGLLSPLLALLAARLDSVAGLALYLVSALPWSAWRPSLPDIQLVTGWLAQPPSSVQR